MTAEEYIVEIGKIAQSNFVASDPTGAMTAAKLGLIVRQVTHCEPAELGFAKFKDALLEVERRGIIRIGYNSKNAFAFWLCDTSAPSKTLLSPKIATEGTSNEVSLAHKVFPFKRLRSAVWMAFIGISPVGKRFIHRDSGEIRLGQPESSELGTECVLLP